MSTISNFSVDLVGIAGNRQHQVCTLPYTLNAGGQCLALRYDGGIYLTKDSVDQAYLQVYESKSRQLCDVQFHYS